MDKILKPYTIIPPNLYVHRDADRQLKNIINDMGRPGYVLVSRQMGKTNLLLNAKRELETSNDAYVYIDLSNPFDTALSCFENIINTTIDIKSERLTDASNQILEIRKRRSDIPAHKLHTQELLILLRSLPGKLVIILDEIDALTRCEYSDNIFSQIRSVYFSRTNFPDLSRLTYILSGVVEPSEIIKDPKISPFNIGQKIFLNDFSVDEFNVLLSQANLNITDDIKKHIFEWTNGNPRITWDVCSEIEDFLRDKKITVEEVDNIINEMYLITYNKPPIDTIREAVKTDSELREAIVEINYGKGKTITDQIKSKLYLSGIINYTDKNIVIKNEIISKALNINWINSLSVEDQKLINTAINYFDKSYYRESLIFFNKYLEISDFDSDSRSTYYYYMGICAYKLSNFDEALEFFDKARFDIHDSALLYYQTLIYKGVLNYQLKNIEMSLQCFKLVFDRGKKDELYARALLNFGSISLESGIPEYIDEAKLKLDEIVIPGAFDSTLIEQEIINEITTLAYCNLAKVSSKEDKTTAINNYKKAIDYATSKTKPKLILELLYLLDNTIEQEYYINAIIDFVADIEILTNKFDYDKPLNFIDNDFKKFLLFCYFFNKGLFLDKIKKYINLLGDKSYSEHLFDLVKFSLINEKDNSKAILLLDDIIKNKNNTVYQSNELIHYEALKLLLYISGASVDFSKSVEFFNLFRSKSHKIIDSVDINVFFNVISVLYNQKKYNEALQYIVLLNRFKSFVSEEHLIDFIIIDYYELLIFNIVNNKIGIEKKANEILKLINDFKIKDYKSSLLGEKGIEVIRQNSDTLLKNFQITKTTNKLGKKIGRNETLKVRYKDGSIVTKKYKKIEDDLKEGLCEIITS